MNNSQISKLLLTFAIASLVVFIYNVLWLLFGNSILIKILTLVSMAINGTASVLCFRVWKQRKSTN